MSNKLKAPEEIYITAINSRVTRFGTESYPNLVSFTELLHSPDKEDQLIRIEWKKSLMNADLKDLEECTQAMVDALDYAKTCFKKYFKE